MDVDEIQIRVNSELAFEYQALVSDGDALLIRTPSPPLAIPLADLVIMEQEYARYVNDIVTYDLYEYVNIAYSDQESTLPERALGLVCSFLVKSRNTSKDVRRPPTSRKIGKLTTIV